ncbi:MAG: polyhydroxyalkanoic acid system family protein [Candidatus Latescibacterota bacterium]
MPTLNMSIQHNLAKEDAHSRIKRFSDEMKSKYAGQVHDLHEEWQENRGSFSLKIMGFALSGIIETTDSAVNFTVEYPFFASPFKSSVEEKVRETARTLLT